MVLVFPFLLDHFLKKKACSLTRRERIEQAAFRLAREFVISTIKAFLKIVLVDESTAMGEKTSVK